MLRELIFMWISAVVCYYTQGWNKVNVIFMTNFSIYFFYYLFVFDFMWEISEFTNSNLFLPFVIITRPFSLTKDPTKANTGVINFRYMAWKSKNKRYSVLTFITF